MPAADRLTLARRLARASLRVAFDAAAEPLGASLPLAPGALTDPARLAPLLETGPFAGRSPRCRPLRIERTAHEAPSSNCHNSVFALDWGDADPDGALPATLFVKQPSADLPTRLFANMIGFWKIECAVCRNLAAELPIETPRIYGVAERGSRFVLLMENLLERPGVRLLDNRVLLEGVDLATARRCLETLARLHAGLSGWSDAARERALPLALHPFRSPVLRPVLQAVNRLAAAPCQRRAPDVFDGECLALYRRALSRWSELERIWYRRPLTLVHGDSHAGNFFAAGDAMGMLDFQGAHWSRGIRDVQYFLINSMQIDPLAAHEKALVEHYAREVTRLGAPLDAEEAWSEYRGFSFQTLMTAVVSLGLGSFTDSDAVVRTMLERAVSATRRLDFERWLGIEAGEGP